jgi:hypothetical protein
VKLLLHIHKGKLMQIRLKAQSATRTQFKLKGSSPHAGTLRFYSAARCYVLLIYCDESSWVNEING